MDSPAKELMTSPGLGPDAVVGQFALEAIDLHKSFGGVEVLHGVDLHLRLGEIHGIVGQNGAGKSTLMKILAGVFARDGGRVRLNGQDVVYADPLAARAFGISMVFQELSLVPTLTVAQNLFLTREPRRVAVLADDRRCERLAQAVLDELGLEISPRKLVERLPVGSRQMVEIAKALTQEAAILILDEPTSSLTRGEVASLFSVMRRLRERGHSILYVSHHLNEVVEICDSVTVLRDGRVALDTAIADTSITAIVTAMLGKSLGDELTWEETSMIDQGTTPLLEVQGLCSGARVRDVSFKLRAGEILGLAGLLGSGRSEVIRAIIGIDSLDRGQVLIDGQPLRLRSPSDAIRRRIGIIPEDRHRQGLMLGISVRDNMLLPVWGRLSRWFLINESRADAEARRFIVRLGIVTRGPRQAIGHLSGGNQQKVVVAKALASDPAILVLDEPTAGIDVQAKRQILEEVRVIAAAGAGVILISSELAELAAVCDRVLVLHHGAVALVLDRARGAVISEEALLHAIQPSSEDRIA
jgi:ribose transport system ATP-binding protein